MTPTETIVVASAFIVGGAIITLNVTGKSSAQRNILLGFITHLRGRMIKDDGQTQEYKMGYLKGLRDVETKLRDAF